MSKSIKQTYNNDKLFLNRLLPTLYSPPDLFLFQISTNYHTNLLSVNGAMEGSIRKFKNTLGFNICFFKLLSRRTGQSQPFPLSFPPRHSQPGAPVILMGLFAANIHLLLYTNSWWCRADSVRHLWTKDLSGIELQLWTWNGTKSGFPNLGDIGGYSLIKC